MDFCAQAEDYVAGRLSNGEVRAFEAHAQTCEACGRALLRRKAVERAAIIMRRNQNAREARPLETTARTPVIEPMPADDIASVSTVKSRELPRAAEALHETPRSRASTTRIVTLLAIAALAGGALLWRSRKEAPDAAAPIAGESAKPETPTEPELTPPPPSEPPTQPAVAAAQADAAPTLEAPPKPAPTVETPPKPASETAVKPAPQKPAAPVNANADLPLDADWDTIVATVNGKKCGPAVAPLRARVTKDGTDAKSWALLAQCYAKRKRWQNVLDAYAMVTQYGDGELVASVQTIADEARAALQPATATDAPPPTQESAQ